MNGCAPRPRPLNARFALPVGIGGAALRSCAGPSRDAWLHLLEQLLPHDAPLRRVPLHIPDERLLGGLDLAKAQQRARVKVPSVAGNGRPHDATPQVAD